jgi:hypothetical protein
MAHIHQSNVPDGMVANCPWGTPLERWSDRMIERGLAHLHDDIAEGVDSPKLRDAFYAEVERRGIDMEVE